MITLIVDSSKKRDTFKKGKLWIVDWNKVFVTHIFGKRYAPVVYKELLQVQLQRVNKE